MKPIKSIYTLTFAGVVLFGSISAQGPFEPFNSGRHKAVLAPGTTVPYSKHITNISNAAGKTSSTAFRLQVEPIGDIMTNKGLDVTSNTATQAQDLFLSPVFMDSTVVISSPTSTRYVRNILMGSILDLKSIYLSPAFTPIVNSTEGFTLDTVFIPASYIKVTAATDTLYTWIVWGDTTQTTVWNKRRANALWNPPIGTWRTNLLGSIVTGATGAAGNKMRSNVPATNRMLIKHVLVNADSSQNPGNFRYIQIPLPTPAMIPADNLVSCFFTFVPGAVYNSGDCIYSFTGASVPQNQNGFAAIVWGQNSPTVNALADYADHQVDPGGYNMGQSYFKQLRHADAGFAPVAYRVHHWGDLTGAPAIVYSVGGPSIQTGIKEFDTKDFALSQNVPNPFTKESTVRFTLAKDVTSAVFTVTDIMGRVVTSEKVATTTGTHSVKLGAYAAGVYYYSLNVDGNVTTKKMIAE